MENASKALIIAGAILLAILIIGLGIYIYGQAANTVSDTGMDTMQIKQFNGQFEQYITDGASAITAKSLIDAVNASNRADPQKAIKLIDGSNNEVTKGSIESTKKYNISVPADGAPNGFIQTIQIVAAE